MMAATTWTFGNNGDYTASFDGVNIVTVTVTATGAYVTSAVSAVAGLEAAQSVAAATVGADTGDVSAAVTAGIAAAFAGDVNIAGNVTIGGS
jgi:hypothetical protein